MSSAFGASALALSVERGLVLVIDRAQFPDEILKLFRRRAFRVEPGSFVVVDIVAKAHMGGSRVGRNRGTSVAISTMRIGFAAVCT